MFDDESYVELGPHGADLFSVDHEGFVRVRAAPLDRELEPRKNWVRKGLVKAMEVPAGNIFDLWRDVGMRTPFIVQRLTSRSCIFHVTRVACRPAQQYGQAIGYPLPVGPPLFEKEYPVNRHYGTTGVETVISNAGSFQWRVLPPTEAPHRWEQREHDICSTAWRWLNA